MERVLFTAVASHDVNGSLEASPAPKGVIVLDFNMPFFSMVSFMVKWTIASIPAAIILFIIGFFIAMIFGSILRQFFVPHYPF